MKIKLVNSTSILPLTTSLLKTPPRDGWRITRSKTGLSRVIRNVKVNGKWTTEDLTSYLKPKVIDEFKKKISTIKVNSIRRKRTEEDKYIIKNLSGNFMVAIYNRSYGTFPNVEKAREARDIILGKS